MTGSLIAKSVASVTNGRCLCGVLLLYIVAATYAPISIIAHHFPIQFLSHHTPLHFTVSTCSVQNFLSVCTVHACVHAWSHDIHESLRLMI